MTIALGAIDNHPVVLHGIGAVLSSSAPDIELVAVASSVDELLAGPGKAAEVVLLDLGMPDTDPPETNIRRLATHGAKVLIYTSEERPVPLRRAVAAGASGLLLKLDPVEAIAEAVRDARTGRLACSGPLAHALLTDDSTTAQLTPRQVEILRSIADGLPYKSVAKRLGITESTVREHLNRAAESYRDRGVEPGNSHGLVTRARRDGHLTV